MADTPDTPDEIYGDPEAPQDKDEHKKAQPWLDLISGFDKAGYRDYQDRCDTIDKFYADANRLASVTRDSEFQIFWANVQVLKPSIYSRPPAPVVVPRFRDRKALPRTASELLERTIIVTFDVEDIGGVMRQVRDDVAILSRGVAWMRYETGDKRPASPGERVCIEWVSRRDFAHDPGRSWKEVDWVAKRSWLTKKEMKDRFAESSGDTYKEAAYEIRKDEHDNHDGKLKAGVWELWCKSADRVLWVSEGCDDVLDSGKPHLDLEGFWPCPQPAYGTLQRGSLIPVPDFVYYQDQISEINALTNRISALSESLKLKGFYPSGAGELGDTIEAAIKAVDDNAVLIGVANWAMIGNGSADKMIVWLPLEMISATITQLVTLRKQLIEDVYQITGLADIMRGASDPSETLGAQQLKSQYGSVRIRDRQYELVRFAKDITRIAAEIMAENFSQKTMLAMSQLDVETDASIGKQVKEIEDQRKAIIAKVQQTASNPQAQQTAQQQPDQAQQMLQQAQGELAKLGEQIDKLKAMPTIEQVMKFLRDERVRPFVLDIETDSTIAPDEDAQKKRATEFVTAVGGFMGQSVPLVQAVPQLAPLISEFLKYVAGQFRAGRQMEGIIDEFADQMATQSTQPKPNPEAEAAAAKVKSDQAVVDAKLKAAQQDEQFKTDADQRAAQAHQQSTALAQQAADHATQLRERETAAKVDATRLGMEQVTQKHAQDMDKGWLEIEALKAKITGLAQPQGDANAAKPPSGSIGFKDLPAEGQAQMAAQAGIHLTPAAMQAHTDAQAATALAAKAVAKPAPASGG